MTVGRRRTRKRTRIGGQFIAHLVEMLESPAYRVMSLSGRRLMARIEIEHGRHGGAENGNLVVTYADLVSYGIDRHAVAPAIREVEALGFLRCEHGRGGNAEFRAPNKFRLTYLPTNDAAPTDDWRNIKTIEEAQAIAAAARKAGSIGCPRKQKTGVGKRQFSVGVSPTV